MFSEVVYQLLFFSDVRVSIFIPSSDVISFKEMWSVDNFTGLPYVLELVL